MNKTILWSLGLIALSGSLTVFSAPAAQASCEDRYAATLVEMENELMPHSLGISAGIGGAEYLMVSTAFAGAGPVNLAPAAVAGAISTVGGGAWTTSELYQENSLKNVLQLLREAKIGRGMILSEIAEELAVPVALVAETVVEADSKERFCSTNDDVQSFREVMRYLEAELIGRGN